jgi:hypothetical protein
MFCYHISTRFNAENICLYKIYLFVYVSLKPKTAELLSAFHFNFPSITLCTFPVSSWLFKKKTCKSFIQAKPKQHISIKR